ncbi:MAG: BtpA/SgcQ family protein [Phycisphaeraceae bacterium]|nr:MAG: BtpA/SgcQ family protein [Phycisphaeraceae bacterium]
MSPHQVETSFPRLLSNGPALIGMIHVGALPGTPFQAGSIEHLAANAAEEARLLIDAGFDAVIIENMHDRPYLHGDKLGPEVVAAMTRVGTEVATSTLAPIGVQILSGGNRQALAVALAIDASFIRCENFVYAHVADEGLLAEAEAGTLLRERKRIGAEHVSICVDIKKKHASHAITADISIEDAAHAAAFFGADALIVTGAWTGRPADPADAARAKKASGLPVLIGSGVTAENVGAMLEVADAAIVGSWIKHDGVWSNPVDPERAARLVGAARG